MQLARAEDAESYQSARDYFDSFLTSPYSTRIASIDTLRSLFAEGYLRTEQQLRSQRAERSARERPALTPGLLPTAPGPRPSTRVHIVVPDVPRPPTREPVPAPAVDVLQETLFYVRTQTPTDHAKSIRAMVGTWEWNTGTDALAEHPLFWGWEGRYSLLPDGVREWQTNARYVAGGWRFPTGFEFGTGRKGQVMPLSSESVPPPPFVEAFFRRTCRRIRSS